MAKTEWAKHIWLIIFINENPALYINKFLGWWGLFSSTGQRREFKAGSEEGGGREVKKNLKTWVQPGPR